VNKINNLRTHFHDAKRNSRWWKFLLRRSNGSFRIVEWGFPDVKDPGAGLGHAPAHTFGHPS
jgi:hypothetical protein